MELLWFDLPDDDGRVTIATRRLAEPLPTTMEEALDTPIRKFRIQHFCGGLMELVERSPRKTVLVCQNCCCATKVPPEGTLGVLFVWSTNRGLPFALALPFDAARFSRWCPVSLRPPSS
jgi:hypothetical protein